MCCLATESTDHPFVICSFTQKIWHEVLFSLNVPGSWRMNGLEASLEDWHDSQKFTSYKYFPGLICWEILKHRNAIFFRMLGKMQVWLF